MAEIKTALVKLFGVEGGFQRLHDDNGNWTGGKVGVGRLVGTKYGISAASYPALDIPNITLDHAAYIYDRDFWSPLRLSEVTSQAIAEEICDTAVNCGVVTAAVIVQESVNLTNYPSQDLVVDGKLGPVSVAAINGHRSPRTLYKALNGFQFIRYLKIIERNPGQEKFIKSWLSRVFEAAA
jgi:lysozyme family protein